MNIYLELTHRFNEGQLRAIICSGQAVVLHRLAIMSKDGDWILRENEACLQHVLDVLGEYGANYRYGAPLDIRWLSGGWSSHLQFKHGPLRVRTDFFTRPPRVPLTRLEALWQEQESRPIPFLDPVELAEMKKTNRERDYAVLGELARKMDSVRDQLLYSRSSRDLMRLADRHPHETQMLSGDRPLLGVIAEGRDTLEAELDKERRQLIRANEERLLTYKSASTEWAADWNQLQTELDGMPLDKAHELMCDRAEGVLPFRSTGRGPESLEVRDA